MFFDAVGSNEAEPAQVVPVLATETIFRRAPFHYRLPIRSSVKPGEYVIEFYFTYFNGEKWVCSKELLKFKVRNVFERYTVAVTALGVTAAAFSLLKVPLKSLWDLVAAGLASYWAHI